MSATVPGSRDIPSKYGGRRTYVEPVLPREELARRARRSSRQRSSPVKTSPYVRREHLAVDRAATVSSISADVGQMSRRKTRRRPCPAPSGSVSEIDVHASRERVRDDERRRREVVRLHLGVDARLEVAVAREHCADDEIPLGDRLRDLLRQRAGVADARRAAVADGVEAELVEVAVETGALVVLASRPSSRARATTSPTASASGRSRSPSSRAGPAPIITDGFDVFVHDVIAVITTEPCSSE